MWPPTSFKLTTHKPLKRPQRNRPVIASSHEERGTIRIPNSRIQSVLTNTDCNKVQLYGCGVHSSPLVCPHHVRESPSARPGMTRVVTGLVSQRHERGPIPSLGITSIDLMMITRIYQSQLRSKNQACILWGNE